MKYKQNNNIELNISEKDSIIVYRQIFGKTERDKAIEEIPISEAAFHIRPAIKMLRFYQNNISEKLGNRCVFDPSCSHYSEQAYRKEGLIKGTILTIKRLQQCRPENGGIHEIK